MRECCERLQITFLERRVIRPTEMNHWDCTNIFRQNGDELEKHSTRCLFGLRGAARFQQVVQEQADQKWAHFSGACPVESEKSQDVRDGDTGKPR